MKLNQIKETLSGAPKQTDTLVKPIFDLIKSKGEYIGDQDHRRVLRVVQGTNEYYGIEDMSHELTTVASFVDRHENQLTLKIIHTLSKFVGNNNAQRLLWFLKSQEGFSMIDYGVQTHSGIRFIKALAKTQRFSVKWLNIKTGEKEDYDPDTDTIDGTKRHIAIMTDWRILIEGDHRPSLPRFGKDFGFPPGCYLWQLFEDEEAQ